MTNGVGVVPPVLAVPSWVVVLALAAFAPFAAKWLATWLDARTRRTTSALLAEADARLANGAIRPHL